MGLLDGLVSFWSMEGDSTDAHGSNDGSDGANVTFGVVSDSKVGVDCAYFSGNGTSITVADDDTLDLTNITIAAWIKRTSTVSNDRFIFDKGDSQAFLTAAIAFPPFTNSKITWQNAGFSDLVSSSEIAVSTWTHVILSFGGSGFKIYINNSLDASDAQAGSLTINADDLVIGGNETIYKGFSGHIDEVGIWNRELTTGERADLYNGGSGAAYGTFTSSVTGPSANPAVFGYGGGANAITGGTINILSTAAQSGLTGVVPLVLMGYIVLTPAAVIAYDVNGVPVRSIAVNPAIIDYAAIVPVITGGTINILAVVGEVGFTSGGLASNMMGAPAAVIDYDALEPSTTMFTVNFDNAFVIYKFILTGASDGLSDIEIPIESFQARMRDDTPTYLSVVVKSWSYASAISARSNGDMILKMGFKIDNEVVQLDEIIKVDLEDIVIDEGVNSKSIGLVGHRTRTYTPKSVSIADINYRRIKGSEYTIRTVRPDIYLRPGDTVTDPDSNSFVVGMISLTMSVGQGTMEISSRSQ